VKRCTLDKIASVTLPLALDRHVVLGSEIPAEAGTVIACRVQNAKSAYNTLENVHGRMVVLQPGDVIAGALGHRDALLGYSGTVPTSVAPGDELQLLNLGGVIGTGASAAPGIGEPFRLEVLGSVLSFPFLDRRQGRPANIADGAIPVPVAEPVPAGPSPPVVAFVGTAMNSGKTTAACALVAALRREGMRVAAGKLTGVSLRRDVLEMADCGASDVALFSDFGIVTTNRETAPDCGRRMLSYLARTEPSPPDVIVLEFGDGLLGSYGVDALLEDPVIRAAIDKVVLCAQDPVGAWGAVKLLRERYDLAVDLVAGKVTDTPAGLSFLASQGLVSWNALRDGSAASELLFGREVQACLSC
jgi:hypothetical protein